MYMYAYINEYTSVHMYVCEYKEEETLINKTGVFFPKFYIITFFFLKSFGFFLFCFNALN